MRPATTAQIFEQWVVCCPLFFLPFCPPLSSPRSLFCPRPSFRAFSHPPSWLSRWSPGGKEGATSNLVWMKIFGSNSRRSFSFVWRPEPSGRKGVCFRRLTFYGSSISSPDLWKTGTLNTNTWMLVFSFKAGFISTDVQWVGLWSGGLEYPG